MSNSTPLRRPRQHQSAKPHPDYPLTAHPSGRWCKKLKGRVFCFGKLDDPQGALDRWLREEDELLAGRVPRDPGDAVVLRDLVNRFLTHKRSLMLGGELSATTFKSYYLTCEGLLEHFGKFRRADDVRQDDSPATEWS